MREELREYPFTFSDGSVSIMGGADEGAFQWLTLNYLLGNLGGRIQVWPLCCECVCQLCAHRDSFWGANSRKRLR